MKILARALAALRARLAPSKPAHAPSIPPTVAPSLPRLRQPSVAVAPDIRPLLDAMSDFIFARNRADTLRTLESLFRERAIAPNHALQSCVIGAALLARECRTRVKADSVIAVRVQVRCAYVVAELSATLRRQSPSAALNPREAAEAYRDSDYLSLLFPYRTSVVLDFDDETSSETDPKSNP